MLPKKVYVFFILFMSFMNSCLYAQNINIDVFAQGSVQYYKAILESKLAFDNGNYEDAQPLLLSIVVADPKHIDSWYMLGTIYFKQLNYNMAKEAFSKVIDIDPGYVPAYQGLALAQEAVGQYRDALLNYQYFIDNFSGEQKDLAVFRTAELYCRFGKYYDAVPLYQSLLSNKKSKFANKARYYYRNINRNMARYRGKKVILDKVPHIVPQQNNCMPSALASVLLYWGEPTSKKELSKILMDTQEGGFIIDMIDYVRELGFDALIFKGNIKDIYYWIKQDVPVIAVQVWENKEGGSIVHLRTIYGYDKLKMSLYTSDIFQMPIADFLHSWNKADNLMVVILPPAKIDIFPYKKPRDAEYTARADRLYRKKEYKKAYQMYLDAEIENGNNLKAKLGQAKSLLKLKKISKAIEELNQVIKADSENQEAYFLLGVIYFNNNQHDKAFDYLKKCVSLKQKLIPEAYNFLGFLNIEKGNIQQGIDELNTAVSIEPGYIYPRYNLACAYAKIGNIDKTVEQLKYCIDSGFISFAEILKNNVFDKFKGYPEFQELNR
ncbi:tetratricopeptide repeat protein [bacterium]|nr:tetratricopeptide repeat protein [bacterium]